MAYDIISDIHGCYDEMIALMQKLGYEVKDGTPVHSEGRTLVFFAGDLTDRGPKSVEVMRFVAKAYEREPSVMSREIIATNCIVT